MKNTLAITLVSLVVSLASVGQAKAAPQEPTQRELELITRRAYTNTYEAKVCIDAVAVERYEMAMGFCYSWHQQALDDKEKAAANLFYAAAYRRINEGIQSERY